MSQAKAQAVPLGTVIDPDGARVGEYDVRLESQSGVVIDSAVSDSSGAFQFMKVSAGDYVLRAPADRGFEAVEILIHVHSSTFTPIAVYLHVAVVAEKVNVTDQTNDVTLDASTNGDQTTANSQVIEKVPVLDQDVVSMFTPFLANSAVGSKGVTLVVDGIEMKGAGVSMSAIKSVSLNNDPYSAEARSPGKGRIEITTKTGTSKFHGTLNFTFRDSGTDATPHFALAHPTEQKRIYEGSITGPLGKSAKSTFLISGTRQEDDVESIVHATDATNTVITQNVPAPVHTTLFAIRAARDLSPTHRISVQYNVEDIVSRNLGVGGLVLAGSGVNSQAREDDLFMNDTLAISPRVVNQFQFYTEKDHHPVRSVTNAPNLPKIVVDGAFTSGGAEADVLDTENTMQINDVVTFSKGRHLFKAGIITPNISRRAWEDHANRFGTLYYASVDAFNAHTPYKFTQETGPGRTTFWANELGTFLSDQIQVKPNLQISLGLRYDWQTYYDTLRNVGPRVSVAYSRVKDRKTVYRAGYGIFYDRVSASSISELKRFNGHVIRSITVNNPDEAHPIPPGQTIESLPTDRTTIAPDASLPLLNFFSFSVDRQLAKGASLSFSYRGDVGLHLLRSVDVNAPVGTAYQARPDLSLGFVRQVRTSGHQVSNALDITFRGNAGRWFTGLAQYTLGRTMNDSGGIAWYPANQYDNSGEYARADFDQLQRFNVLGTFNEGHWLSLGVAANLNSGMPYTETSGVDAFNTGLLNERPAGVRRNSLQAAGYANLDLRWSHDFRVKKNEELPVLTFAVDAFNVVNHTNYTTYVGNVQSSFFEQPTSTMPARRIQFTLRAKF